VARCQSRAPTDEQISLLPQQRHFTTMMIAFVLLVLGQTTATMGQLVDFFSGGFIATGIPS
jgi:hypothetical protein